jgi:hypothetical protein
MPAPTSAQLVSFINQSFQQQGSGGSQFFQTVATAIASGWSTWETGLVVGALTCSGAGVGAWAGMGQGGAIGGAPYQLPPTDFDKQDAKQVKLVNGLRQVLPQFMTTWSTSFKFLSLAYIGASTATIPNPGTVTATNTPTPLGSAGKGTDPIGAMIAQAWLATLTPPDFDLSSPKGKTQELVNAISSAIEQAFGTIWLLGATVTGNALSGAAAPGGVVSGLPSQTNGKIV